MSKQKTLHIPMLGQKQVISREKGVEIMVEELSTRMARLGYVVKCNSAIMSVGKSLTQKSYGCMIDRRMYDY